jgi:hypothetical protein
MESAPWIRQFQVLSVATVLAATVIGVSPIVAQTPAASGTTPAPGAVTSPGVGVVAPHSTQPPPEFGFEPALPPEQGTSPEDYHGERRRSLYQPAFVKGAVNMRIPYDDPQSSGGPAFGLTIEWGTPLEPPAEPVVLQR